MNKLRENFPILKQKMSGQPLIYFDNAATTQKPNLIIDSISLFYKTANANVHRSINPLAERATTAYENARKKIADFINCKHQEIVFVRNTTEAINLVAKSWADKNLKKGDVVAVSSGEHHSNIIPWLQLKNKKGIKIKYIPLNNSMTLDLIKTKKMLRGVKLFCFAYCYNTTGAINSTQKLIKLAKEVEAYTLVDGAQAVGHFPVDIKKIDCDFFAFSGHKMYGPSGVGALYAKYELLQNMEPFLGGGEMIKSVTQNEYISADAPTKFEAGTPNIEGTIGLGFAVNFIKKLGWKKIMNEENNLRKYLISELLKLKFIEIYNASVKNGLAVAMFNIKNVHSHDTADLLGNYGIAVRAGFHCAEPLHQELGIAGSVRASLAFYNTKQEIDIFIMALKEINKKFNSN